MNQVARRISAAWRRRRCFRRLKLCSRSSHEGRCLPIQASKSVGKRPFALASFFVTAGFGLQFFVLIAFFFTSPLSEEFPRTCYFPGEYRFFLFILRQPKRGPFPRDWEDNVPCSKDADVGLFSVLFRFQFSFNPFFCTKHITQTMTATRSACLLE